MKIKNSIRRKVLTSLLIGATLGTTINGIGASKSFAASNNNEIKISVKIAERTYRLTIDKADEEKVMKAVTILNDRVQLYKQAYDYKDYQDLLSMVCLQLATLNVKYESDAAYKDQCLEQKLDEISVLLSENIESK